MNYNWLTYEEIKKVKYPNVLAEIKESGYSICEISERMGYGKCEEDNQMIWNKLTGRTEMDASEFAALIRLFDVQPNYIMSRTLSNECGKPTAFWRWLEWNQKKAHNIARIQAVEKINRELKNNPYLLELINIAVSMNKEQIRIATKMLHALKNAPSSATNTGQGNEPVNHA